MGMGQRNNLPGIRGVGEYFLVAGNRRIEDDLSDDKAIYANSSTLEQHTVFECKYCSTIQAQISMKN